MRRVVSTVRRDNVQFFTKRRFSALFWLTGMSPGANLRTSPGANFHIGGRVCMQLFTYEIMSEINSLTHAKDCDANSLRKTSLCMRNFLTYIWTCSHANFLMRGRVCIHPVPQFPMIGLERHVSTQCVDYKSCSWACSHTKRPVTAHFSIYEVISMRNVKHMTPCWSPKFSIDKSKWCTTAWLNLRTLLSMQFITYEVMSENSGWTHAKDCDACSLWKDVPLHNFLTYTDVFASMH